MTQEKAIIAALVRCVMATNPNEATKHQIDRLIKCYREQNLRIANTLSEIISPIDDQPNGKLVQSITPSLSLK